MGYEVFDNFPLFLIEPLLADDRTRRVALGVDTRTRGFDTKALIDAAGKHQAKLLFITCDENVLYKRFTETRRRHPMARDKTVISGIQKEAALLSPLREAADLSIDTSELSIHDLRHILEGHFQTRGHREMTVSLLSFGFRKGIPREADILMDVRFLKNPHWEEALRPLTGLDESVGAHIESDPDFPKFFENLTQLIEPLIPRYVKEGKTYLTIAVGCTGGRHRSIYVVEKLSKWLKNKGINSNVVHRDTNLKK